MPERVIVEGRYYTEVLTSNQLGRYRLIERLGEGGMAEVFRAELMAASSFQKIVAIKRIKPALASEREIGEMILREAQVAARMQHGGIVQIVELGHDDDEVPYLVMELVDGVPLGRLIDGPVDVAAALHVVEQVAAALHYAHTLVDSSGRETPVVHRDVNPRNILVSGDGVVKLTDFGIAKAWHLPSVTLPGTVKGTLGYLAPEQARGGEVDARTDQFSAGVVLYELLAGENPLAGQPSLVDYCKMLESGLPRLPVSEAAELGIDDALADIVARAVAVAPEARFPSMDDLRAELERWRVRRGLRAAPELLRERVRRAQGHATTAELSLGKDGGKALGAALAAQLEAREAHTEALARTMLPGAANAPEGETEAAGSARRRVLALGSAALALAAVLAWLLWPQAPSDALAQGEPLAPASASGAGDVVPVSEHPAAVAGAASPAAAGAAAAQPDQAAAQPAPATTPAMAPADAAGRAAGDARTRAADATRPNAVRAAAAAEPGRLRINLLPYARVRVDGRERGQTPVDLRLAAGAHTLVLENPDTGQRREQRLELAPGQTLTINDW
ncbi:serine/threonine-protein kinase [Haliangium ochraceum]|uniref:Serine/threonine protein kinase n=1 Tax=Haliangium ochraceum (strain DSM 14365 / JCM 11303 / SMP-2) TaxID=502025 RepID=D0LXC9_HALO1|nr:serine/threonine-protein kinase [Haliangium ochraceum]ACY16171.1 serine/threonine protein kinase [Haliangium ochraceum DSM 14365]